MPVSFQTLSRFGPRHCGQSAALAERDNSMANKVANPNLEWKFIESFVKCMVILSGKRLILRDTVEVPVGAEENLTAGNGWRRVARLAPGIHGQKLELLPGGPKNGGGASSAPDKQTPRRHPQRNPP